MTKKLTPKQAADLRARYEAGGLSLREAGRELGVSHGSIHNVVTGRTFKDVEARPLKELELGDWQDAEIALPLVLRAAIELREAYPGSRNDASPEERRARVGRELGVPGWVVKDLEECRILLERIYSAEKPGGRKANKGVTFRRRERVRIVLDALDPEGVYGRVAEELRPRAVLAQEKRNARRKAARLELVKPKERPELTRRFEPTGEEDEDDLPYSALG